MLDCKGKDKAMKRSKKNAQKAYQMGLYDEENSMCYAKTRKQESIRRKSIAPDSLSSSRHGKWWSERGEVRAQESNAYISESQEEAFSAT